MTEHAPQAGGTAWELGRASERMSAAMAVGDSAALALAMADYAAVLGNVSTGSMAAIAKPLFDMLQAVQKDVAALKTEETPLSKQLSAVVHQLENARTADLDWRTHERTLRDKQADRLYEELDELKALASDGATRLGKLEKGQDTSQARLDALDARHGRQWQEVIARLDEDQQRLDRKHEQISDIDARLSALQKFADKVAELLGLPPPLKADDDGHE